MMETQMNRSPHPLMITAAVAVILFCAAGIAAIMGWIPTSVGKSGEASGNPAIAEKAAALPATSETPKSASERGNGEPSPHAQPAARSTAVSAGEVAPPHPVAPVAARALCRECGVVESVREVETQGQASGLGAVGGAVVGGVLGNQVGGGRGRNVMTVVGAVGGALAGNQVEKKVKSTKHYEILVRFEDGSRRAFSEPNAPVWQRGDRVRVNGNRIEPNG